MKNRFILSATLIILFFSCSGNKTVNNVWKGTAYGTAPWEFTEEQESERDAVEKLLHEHIVVKDGRFVFTADRDGVAALGLPENYYEKCLETCNWMNRNIRSQNRWIRKQIKNGMQLPADDYRTLWEIQCQEYAKSGKAQINPDAVLEEK